MMTAAQSLQKIKESATDPSLKMDKDYSTEGDMMSVYSQQEGVFYQPDKIKGEQR